MTEQDIRTYVSVSCDDGNMNTLRHEIRYTLESSDISDLRDKGLPDSKYEPQKGDKIYFLPGCTVPRFKVKQFCEKYGVALVKDPERANIKFAGPETIKEIVKLCGHYYLYKSDFLSFWRSRLLMTDHLEKIFKDIEESDLAVVDVGWPIYNSMRIADKRFNKCIEGPESSFVDQQAAQKYIYISSGVGVYNQTEILRRINTGGIMGKEQYHSIKRLFESTDNENLKLAMEMMANCDYEQSCVYLLLLMRDYGVRMDKCPSKHHVNFKSLLKFFDIDHRRIDQVDVTVITNTLIKRKLLNKSNMDMLMPEVLNAVVENSYYLEHFTVKGIEPKELLIDAVKENILDAKCDTEVVDDCEEVIPKGIPVL